MYPKIKFDLNIPLDFGIGSKWPYAVTQYPEILKGSLDKFVNYYYQEHDVDLKQSLKIIEHNWNKVRSHFFKVSDKVFNNYSWPDGKYICFLSIFNCNPRFLDDKTFQIFYRTDVNTNVIIAHEMLHFIFYDYFEKRENDLYNKLGTDGIWRLSESFDILALENPIYKILNPKVSSHYPELNNLTDLLRNKMTGQDFTVSNFIKSVYTPG